MLLRVQENSDSATIRELGAPFPYGLAAYAHGVGKLIYAARLIYEAINNFGVIHGAFDYAPQCPKVNRD